MKWIIQWYRSCVNKRLEQTHKSTGNAHTLAAQWLFRQDSKVTHNNTPKRESAGLRNKTRQERIIMAKHRKCESYKINKFLHLGSKGYGCKVVRGNSIKNGLIMIIKSYDYSHNTAYNKPRFQGSDTWICKPSPLRILIWGRSASAGVWVWVTYSTLTVVWGESTGSRWKLLVKTKTSNLTDPKAAFQVCRVNHHARNSGLLVLVHVWVSFRLFITVMQLIITYFSVGRTCNSVYHQNLPQRQEIITSVMRFSPLPPILSARKLPQMKGRRQRRRETGAIGSGRERSDTGFFSPRAGVIALYAAVNGGQKTRLYFPPAGASEAEPGRDQLMGIDRKCRAAYRAATRRSRRRLADGMSSRQP